MSLARCLLQRDKRDFIKISFIVTSSCIMTQERLHALTRYTPGWILDNLSLVITEYGFVIPFELILPDNCWLLVLQQADADTVANFRFISRNAHKISTQIVVNQDKFEDCIACGRLDILKSRMFLISPENILPLLDLSARVNRKAFCMLFKRGEYIYNSRSDQSYFRKCSITLKRIHFSALTIGTSPSSMPIAVTLF